MAVDKVVRVELLAVLADVAVERVVAVESVELEGVL